MAKLSALGYLGLAKETVFGTAVAPTVFIPYESVKIEDEIKQVADEGRRGILTKDFGIYNTTRQAKVEFDGPAYPDILGNMLLGIFGQKTTTGAATPYSHKFTVLNANAPSFTMADYNVISGVNERRFAGAVIEEVGFKFDADTMLKVSTKMKTKTSTLVAKATPTVAQTLPFMGYTSSLKIGGTANTNLLGGEVTIKREASLIFAGNNTQDPTKYVTGRIEASGKLTFDVEDETEYLLFLNDSNPSIQITFTQDANTSLDFMFSKVEIAKAHVDRSQESVRVDLEFKAIYNATDAGMGAITLKNSVATY